MVVLAVRLAGIICYKVHAHQPKDLSLDRFIKNGFQECDQRASQSLGAPADVVVGAVVVTGARVVAT